MPATSARTEHAGPTPVAARLRAARGVQAHGRHVRGRGARVIDAAADEFGGLDGAVNNAGIVSGPTARLHEVAEADWERVLAVNLTGVWLSMKYELPHLLAAGGGSIVNMSSIAVLVASRAGSGAYGTTKHGVIGLTKTAAFEYAGDGVRVNAVCLGVIRTPLVEEMVASGHIGEGADG
jgi:NAD(P)-dependent dehydrogenase (short-subunit alcohol dehydrogenase family)